MLQRKLLVSCRGLWGMWGSNWPPLNAQAAAPCRPVAIKGKNPEASTQWSKTVVSTTEAVLFLPARTCTPPNYGKARFAAHLGLNGCPLTAIVPRAKQNHKL